MIGHEAWQLEGSAPALYERFLVPAMTAMWADDLVARAAVGPGETVLDAACGTGIVARRAASCVGVTGRVHGVDLNPGMLAIAGGLPVAEQVVPIEWHEAGVQALPFPDRHFDVVLCQFGLQFFPDRVDALREMRRTLRPDGRLALNVFGPIDHNPATHALADALDRVVAAGASATKRAEHALADRGELGAVIAAAGFNVDAITTETKMVHFPSVRDYVGVQMTATPLAALTAGLDAAERQRLLTALGEQVAGALAPYVTTDGLAFPQEVHVAVASVRLGAQGTLLS